MRSCGSIFGITPEKIQEALMKTAEIQRYYEVLINLAPTKKEADILRKNIADNSEVLSNFKQLYYSIECAEPILSAVPFPSIKSYLEGLVQVRNMELENLPILIQMYISAANIYYSSSITSIGAVIGIASNYANMHSTNIQYIITLNLCS